jgi:hypothetical protein
VSAFVNFHEFVRPVIRRSLGDPRPFLPVLDAMVDTEIKKGAGREELVRVALSWIDGRLHARATTRGQGSHMLSSIAGAHGFALVAAERTLVAAGETIAVQVYDPTFLEAEQPGTAGDRLRALRRSIEPHGPRQGVRRDRGSAARAPRRRCAG